MGKFLHKWALIRMCVGIFIVLDGYPLGFFFKETVGIPLDSAVFTAGFMILGMLLMTPTTAFRTLYAPNAPVFNALIAFVLMCVLYSFMFNSVALGDRNRDLVYYLFVIFFLLLLVNVPNEITTQIVVVGVVFTL